MFSSGTLAKRGCNGRIADIDKGLRRLRVLSSPFLIETSSLLIIDQDISDRIEKGLHLLFAFLPLKTNVVGAGNTLSVSIKDVSIDRLTCCPLEYGTRTPNCGS